MAFIPNYLGGGFVGNFTQVIAGVGSKTAPSYTNNVFGTTGWYFTADGKSLVASVAGTDFVKIQPSPFRFFIGRGAETAIPQGTFSVVDVDAFLPVNRTIAAESAIATLVQGTGGGQQRGMVSGGFRWTNGGATQEFMRLTFGSDAALSINAVTALGHLHVQQPAASSINLAKWRSNIGRNVDIFASGSIAVAGGDSTTEGASIVSIGRGNSGAGNTTAAIRFGFNSGGDMKFNHYMSPHHNAGSNLGNYIRCWSHDIGGSGSVTDFNNDCQIVYTWGADGRMVINSQTLDANYNFRVVSGNAKIDDDLTTGGGRIIKITDVNSATYTVLSSDHYLQVRRTSTGTCTITLPAIGSSNEGQIYYIKDSGYNASANNITINTTGADTIQNAASATITGDGNALSICANNTSNDWEIF